MNAAAYPPVLPGDLCTASIAESSNEVTPSIRLNVPGLERFYYSSFLKVNVINKDLPLELQVFSGLLIPYFFNYGVFVLLLQLFQFNLKVFDDACISRIIIPALEFLRIKLQVKQLPLA